MDKNTEFRISGLPLIIPAGSSSGEIFVSTFGFDDSDVEIMESIDLIISSISNASSAEDTLLVDLESDDDYTDEWVN